MNWIPWTGGRCPVAFDTMVAVTQRDGLVVERPAGVLAWAHYGIASDIRKYREVGS